MLDRKVSFFSPAGNPRAQHIQIKTLLQWIRTGKFLKVLQDVRRIKTQEGEGAYAKAKFKKLPAIIWQADMVTKKKEVPYESKGIQPSGLLPIDVDLKTQEEAQEVKRQLMRDPLVAFAFISPGKDGVKAAFVVPSWKSEAEYKFIFRQVQAYLLATYQIQIDSARCDVVGLCFVSDDAECYENKQAGEKVFSVDFAVFHREQEEEERKAEQARQEAKEARVRLRKQRENNALEGFEAYLDKVLEHDIDFITETIRAGVPGDSVASLHKAFLDAGLRAGSILAGYAARRTSDNELERLALSVRSDINEGKAKKTFNDGVKIGKNNPKREEELFAAFERKREQKQEHRTDTSKDQNDICLPTTPARPHDQDAVCLPEKMYLGMLPEVINAIDKHSEIAIYAGTNSGKSRLAETLSRHYSDRPVILTVPTRILATNKQRDEGMEFFDVLVSGTLYEGGHAISTYDSLTKIPEEARRKAVFIIDEYHEMTLAFGYRSKAIRTVQEFKRLAWKTIILTGTPVPSYIHDPQAEKVLRFYRESDGYNAEMRTMAVRQKASTLFAMKRETTTAGTWLVFVRSKKRAERLTKQAELKGYFAAYVHRDNPTDGHHIGVLQKHISTGLDFLFVTVYPAAGVDIDSHNVTQIIYFDTPDPIIARQLPGRLRNGVKPELTFFWVEPDRPRAPYTAKRADRDRKKDSALARCVADFYNRQRKAGTFRNPTKRAFDVLGYKHGDNISLMITDGDAGFYVDMNGVDATLYKRYIASCVGNLDFYRQELSRYGITTNLSEKTGQEASEIELLQEQAAQKTIKKEAQERFKKELAEAANMTDSELKHCRFSGSNVTAKTLSELTAISGSRRLATQILHKEQTNNARTIGKVKRQIQLMDALNVDQPNWSLKDCQIYIATGEKKKWTSSDIQAVFSDAFELHEKTMAGTIDPRIFYLLRKGKLSERTAVKLFLGIFESKRGKLTQEEMKNAGISQDSETKKRVNCYIPTGLDPLEKYRQHELPKELSIQCIEDAGIIEEVF